MAKMVQMMALAMGTISGARGILHTDERKGADLAARYPLVSEEDAVLLEGRKLAKRYDGSVPSADDEDEGLDVDSYAERETKDVNEAENSVDQTTGLATRATTAFERPPEQLVAGASGRTLTAEDNRSAPASPDDAPAGGGAKSLSSMNSAELVAANAALPTPLTTALDNDGKEIPFDTATNKQKAAAIQKARDASAPQS